MAAGYWSDFIDPASGRAVRLHPLLIVKFIFACLQFYSCHSQSVLFETDDKFRCFGFEIQDLGCCKCIMHPQWGSYTFVGTIFTNAPMNSPVLEEIMNI